MIEPSEILGDHQGVPVAARLAARWSTETARRAFADDIGDASGEFVVATPILGTRRRGACRRMITYPVPPACRQVAKRGRKGLDVETND